MTPVGRKSFNLVDEPWISVLGTSGRELVSLRDAFARSREFRALAGELPTQDAAVLRILLAILTRAAGVSDGSPTAQWVATRATANLGEVVADYLDAFHHRFDLIDRDAPFLQVAGLTAKGPSGLIKLIADVPDGHPFFATRGGAALKSMGFEEAARWIIHCQAYDPSGIKTGVDDDRRVKNGKSYPIGTGWLGRCGLVLVEGATLHDTLMFNLVVRAHDALSGEDDLPVWEREPLRPGPEPGHALPTGSADLMTWPARRLLLHHDGHQVVDVLLTNGDPVPLANQHHLEFHSAFRRSPGLEKTLSERTVYAPRSHDPSRAFWRGLSITLAESVPGGAPRNDAPSTLPPGIIDWISRLRREGAINGDESVRLRAVGMAYGTNDAIITATIDDSLALHVAVASEPVLKGVVVEAVEKSDRAGQLIAGLAADVARAAGRAPDGPRDAAREELFFRLEVVFREWLGGLRESTDVAAARLVWEQHLRRTVLSVGTGIVSSGGESAWKGHEVNGRVMTSALAHKFFLHKLSDLLIPIPSQEKP